MAIIRTWSGDNAPLGDLTTSTAGDGDHPFNHRVGTMTVAADGLRPNAISIPDASAVKRCGWAEVPGYPLTSYAVRMYLTMNGYGPSEVTPIQSNDTGVQTWRIGITSGGLLRIRSGSTNTTTWTGTTPLPLNQPIRIEAVDTNNTVTVTAYLGDTMTALDTGSGAGGTVEAIWLGCTTAAATDGWYVDDLALADTADLIGPAAEPPPTYPPRHRYDGTTWIPLGNTHLIEE